ncbi:hypothetical protein VTO73DRAFT_8724 [Trametes versicolor]
MPGDPRRPQYSKLTSASNSPPWAKKSGYAILSHVWALDNSKEQTFADIERLQSEGVTSYDDPRVSAKIRGCVEMAKEQGLGWVWDDTCCIDKRSSAELEEAINSMFRWYAEAAVCFALLEDVEDECVVQETNSAFRRSVWFTRGWTLQELLAPQLVLFFSQGWKCLGTKVGLARLVCDITGIDIEVLTMRRALKHVSVARRMLWAANRRTSRIEDRAYALLGIFDVSMSTIYGEGSYAFRRLQVKIMKRNAEHTLFAWGEVWKHPGGRATPATSIGGRGRGAPGRPRKAVTEPLPTTSKHVVPHVTPPPADDDKGLFAQSPSDFRHVMTTISVNEVIELISECVNVPIIPQAAPVYEHAITNSGVRCRFIVIPGNPFALALLLCKNQAGECVALPIWPQPGASYPERFLVGVSFASDTFRLIPVCRSTIDALRGLGWTPNRMDIQTAATLPRGGLSGAQRHMPTGIGKLVYIVNNHPSFTSRSMLGRNNEPRKLCIPAWLVSHLALYGLELQDSPAFDEAVEAPSKLRVIHHAQSKDTAPQTAFIIHFSLCEGKLVALVELPRSEEPRGPSYAAVCAQDVHDPSTDDCPRPNPLGPHQHLSAWEHGSKTFVCGDREVRLTATPTPPTCDSYTLEILLEGPYYDTLRASRRASTLNRPEHPPLPVSKKTRASERELPAQAVPDTRKSKLASSWPKPQRQEDIPRGFAGIFSSLSGGASRFASPQPVYPSLPFAGLPNGLSRYGARSEEGKSR